MSAASATVRTNTGPLPLSKAQRSHRLSLGFVLADSVICNIHWGRNGSCRMYTDSVRDSLAAHASRLHGSRKEAGHAEVPARRLRQGRVQGREDRRERQITGMIWQARSLHGLTENSTAFLRSSAATPSTV